MNTLAIQTINKSTIMIEYQTSTAHNCLVTEYYYILPHNLCGIKTWDNLISFWFVGDNNSLTLRIPFIKNYDIFRAQLNDIGIILPNRKVEEIEKGW